MFQYNRYILKSVSTNTISFFTKHFSAEIMALAVSICRTWIAINFPKVIQELTVQSIPVIDWLQQSMSWKPQRPVCSFGNCSSCTSMELHGFYTVLTNKSCIRLSFRRSNCLAICWNLSLSRQRRWNHLVQSLPKRRSRYIYTS